MSLPLCTACLAEMTRTEMAVCEMCQKCFCYECMPTHESCASRLLDEERVHCPERARV
jgi:hypothetical protein